MNCGFHRSGSPMAILEPLMFRVARGGEWHTQARCNCSSVEALSEVFVALAGSWTTLSLGAALISCEWFWQAGESRMEDILARERAVADMFGWTHLEGKHKDDGWDMVTPDGSRVTIRFDVMSEETGMHFLELEQRADRGSRWKASGFGLARRQAHYWVMANSHSVYVAPTKALWRAVKKSRADEKHSRRDLEDKEKRMYSRGQIIPLKTLESVCIIVCGMPD